MRRAFNLWGSLSPAWQFAIGGFFVARLVLISWSFVIYLIFPIAIQNHDQLGAPLLTAFNLRTGERYVYSRRVSDIVLTFRVVDDHHVVDDQTGSLWLLQTGQAIQGKYAGSALQGFTSTVEDIFPYLEVNPTKNFVLSLWQRFDVNWYLKIATRGYENDGSTVYFPAYPMLIRSLAFFMDPMLAATLISNISLIGVLGLLYHLTASVTTGTHARRTIIYFLLFPTAFFLTAAYTESLFLLFALASLFAASRGQWGWTALWGALSSLTRLQGVLMIVPLAYLVWRETRGLAVNVKLARAAPLVIIPLAAISFLAFTNLSLFDTYRETLNARFVSPWGNILAAMSLLSTGNGSIVDVLNLVFTLGMIISMYAVWRKLPPEYVLYSLPMVVAPMLRMTVTQPLVSMTRYALVVFPMFMVLSYLGEHKWINRMIIYLSLFLQLYLSAQFILWGWVA